MAFYRVRAGLEAEGASRTAAGTDPAGSSPATSPAIICRPSASCIRRQAMRNSRSARTISCARMKEVQDKRGDGYLGAIITADNTDAHDVFAQRVEGRHPVRRLRSERPVVAVVHAAQDVRRPARCVPPHRQSDGARRVELKFATWAEGVLTPMTDAQVQKMLLTEHGGMNEILADLYADTGDKRWLDLVAALRTSRVHRRAQAPPGQPRRQARQLPDPEAHRIGGALRLHRRSAGHHGRVLLLGPRRAASQLRDGRARTGRVLRPARSAEPARGRPRGRDVQRLQHDQAHAPAVFAAAGCVLRRFPGTRAVQSHPRLDRSRRRPHVVHGAGRPRRVSRNTRTCSRASRAASAPAWRATRCTATGCTTNPPTRSGRTCSCRPRPTFANGVNLKMDTGFPGWRHRDDGARRCRRRRAFTLAVRRPVWAGDGFVIKRQRHGARAAAAGASCAPAAPAAATSPANDPRIPASTYVEIKRTWKAGDVVELALPKSLHLEPTPDNKTVAAIMWGPLVLAGDHGPRRDRRSQANAGQPAVPRARPPPPRRLRL